MKIKLLESSNSKQDLNKLKSNGTSSKVIARLCGKSFGDRRRIRAPFKNK